MLKLRRRRLIAFGLLAVDLFVLGALAAHFTVASAARGRTYSDAGLIPHRHVGLVLGCPKRIPDGRLNLFFLARVKAAAELYKQGKVDFLLASGDRSTPGDDEPADLRKALIDEGVPAARIYVDYAGFRTLDSVIRAKEVFGQMEITVISQESQDQRAIFIARHARMDAIGFNAADVFSWKAAARECLARVKAVLDVYVLRAQPRSTGQTVAIGSATQSPGAPDKEFPH